MPTLYLQIDQSFYQKLFMKKILLLIFSIATLQAIGQNQKADKRFEGLDTVFARVLQDWHGAGFAVAVVEKDQIVYAKGFGFKDYENKIPVTTSTQFAIGSCTKAFTASLLGILKKEGKVDFDKPVRDYLPALKFYNNNLNNYVTLRDMMSHRTSLPRHDFSWYLFQSHSRDSLIERIQYLQPEAGLREEWLYNNFMFMAQGAVVENISGKSWEDNIREEIFMPLGMNESNVTLNEWEKNGNAAIGYSVKKDSIIQKLDYYDIAAMSPAGSINSSVNDMAKWVITWINGGKFQGKEILPAAHVQDAISSQMVIGSGFPGKLHKDMYFANYGLGWGLSSYRGHYRVEHGGNIDGFSANTSFFPADSIGIIVLCNQDGSSVPSIVRNILADRMLQLQRNDWESEIKNAADVAKKESKDAEKNIVSTVVKNTNPTHSFNDYEGNFENPGYGTIAIKLVNDSLYAQAGVMHIWLSHYMYDIFQPMINDRKTGIDTADKSFPKFSFSMNEAGDIVRFSVPFEAGIDPIVFTKKLQVQSLAKDSLKQYTGDYLLNGITIKIFLKGDATLMMLVPGQPEYELLPLGNDRFALKGLQGYTIQFNKNETSEIIELLSQQPNGVFKATKKK